MVGYAVPGEGESDEKHETEVFSTALPAGHLRPPRLVSGHSFSAEFINVAAPLADLPVLGRMAEWALGSPQAADHLVQGGAVQGGVVYRRTWRTPAKPRRIVNNYCRHIS